MDNVSDEMKSTVAYSEHKAPPPHTAIPGKEETLSSTSTEEQTVTPERTNTTIESPEKNVMSVYTDSEEEQKNKNVQN